MTGWVQLWFLAHCSHKLFATWLSEPVFLGWWESLADHLLPDTMPMCRWGGWMVRHQAGTWVQSQLHQQHARHIKVSCLPSQYLAPHLYFGVVMHWESEDGHLVAFPNFFVEPLLTPCFSLAARLLCRTEEPVNASFRTASWQLLL